MGALNRRIRIVTRAGEARGAVEDDFHHFRVRTLHEGARVVGIQAEALRQPWSICGSAGAELQGLVGMSLSVRLAEVLAFTDQSLHCTHLLDLAALTIAAAARGRCTERTYEAAVPDRTAGRTTPQLICDGVETLRWDVAGNAIIGPSEYEGLSLGAGFSRWIGAHLRPDQAEAAFVLRRAVFISGGRGVALDRMRHAPARGVCFAQQPVRAQSAARMVGSTQDFSSRPEALLRDDAAWLAFAV